MKVKIQRQQSPVSEPYWETFDADVPGDMSIAGLIDHLNYRDDILDENGRKTTRIGWECSCLQGICGSCAMVINGKPSLACLAFIDADAADVLTVEPLSKFPVVVDLVVDRACILEHQKDALMFLGSKRPASPCEAGQQYTVAKCLKCGLCLEVCPNYVGGEGRFYGAPLANEACLLHSLSEDRRKELKRQYRKHFERGCSKSLACRDVCPAKIATLSSIGYMNR